MNILNDIILFFKIIFNISILKLFKNTKNILIWSKEKNKTNLNFFKNIFQTQKQTGSQRKRGEVFKKTFEIVTMIVLILWFII